MKHLENINAVTCVENDERFIGDRNFIIIGDYEHYLKCDKPLKSGYTNNLGRPICAEKFILMMRVGHLNKIGDAT